MRIQAQRETFALRIVAFDWRPTGSGPCPVCGTDHSQYGCEMHRSPMESGHELQTWSWHPTEHLPGTPDDHSWQIVDPSKYPREPSKYESHGGDWLLADGGGDSQSGQGHYPTREHAQQAAEEAYKQMFPIGPRRHP